MDFLIANSHLKTFAREVSICQTYYALGEIDFSTFFSATTIKIVGAETNGSLNLPPDLQLIKLFDNPAVGSILDWILETDSLPISLVGESDSISITKSRSKFYIEVTSISPLTISYFSTAISDSSTGSNNLTIDSSTGYILFSGSRTTISSTGSLYWDITNQRMSIGQTGAETKLQVLDYSSPQLRLSTTGEYSDFQTTQNGNFYISPTVDSITIGYNPSQTQGSSNIAIGNEAGQYQGIGNIAIGTNAGQTQGSYNIAIGYYAGQTVATGAITIGYYSGSGTTSSDTIVFGSRLKNVNGIRFVIGSSGLGLTGFQGQTSVAFNTPNAGEQGDYSVMFSPVSSLPSGQGDYSVFSGTTQFTDSEQGDYSVAIRGRGSTIDFRDYTTGLGEFSLIGYDSTGTTYASAIGYQAGSPGSSITNSASTRSCFLGNQGSFYPPDDSVHYDFGRSVSIGNGVYPRSTDIHIGRTTRGALSIGYNNLTTITTNTVTAGIKIGAYAMDNLDDIPFSNIIIGPYAGYLNGPSQCTCVGSFAVYQNTVLNTGPTVFGAYAGYNNIDNARAIGSYAGYDDCQGGPIGYQAGYISQRGSAIGRLAGAYSQQGGIALGYQAGLTNQTASSFAVNATTSYVSATGLAGFYLAPIRLDNTQIQALCYNTSTYEVTYSTAGVKTFVVEHPELPDSYLIHGCLEGPEAGIYYRGEGRIEAGNNIAKIELPTYTKKFGYDFTVIVTEYYSGNFDLKLFVSEVVHGKFQVEMELPLPFPVEFSWIVYGSRGELQTTHKKSAVKVNGVGPYKYIEQI